MANQKVSEVTGQSISSLTRTLTRLMAHAERDGLSGNLFTHDANLPTELLKHCGKILTKNSLSDSHTVVSYDEDDT